MESLTLDHARKHKQVLYKVVIRFLRDSEKTIRNSWNKTVHKEIFQGEGSWVPQESSLRWKDWMPEGKMK